MFKCHLCNIFFPNFDDLVKHKCSFYITQQNLNPEPLEQKAPAEKEIKEVVDDILQLLLNKNQKYGNSALNPIRVFSKANASEQIRIRIDDKLSRIVSGQSDDDEDVIDDLLGYLVLLKISLKKEKNG